MTQQKQQKRDLVSPDAVKTMLIKTAPVSPKEFKDYKKCRDCIRELENKNEPNSLVPDATSQMKEAIRNVRKRLKEPAKQQYEIILQRRGLPSIRHVFEVPPGGDVYKAKTEALRRARTELTKLRSERRLVPEDIANETGRAQPGVMYSTHKTPGWFLKRMSEILLEQVTQPKAPDSLRVESDRKLRYIGVEIECIVSDREALRRLLASNPKIARVVHLGTDGSVHHESSVDVEVVGEKSSNRSDRMGRQAIELRILAKEDDFGNIMREVCKYLHDSSVSAWVNQTCGLHIHLDCRPGIGRKGDEVYKRLVRALPLLTACVSKSRRTNQYCTLNISEELGGFTSQGIANETRRYAINASALNKHKTVEVRLHQGTTNLKKILNWTDLLLTICDAPDLPIPIPGTLDEIASKISLSSDVRDYWKERIMELNSAPYPFLGSGQDDGSGKKDGWISKPK